MTVPVKIFGGYHGGNRVKLESLFNLNAQIFYGVKEEDDMLRSSESIFDILFGSDLIIKEYDERYHSFKQSGKKGVLFIRVSQGNLKYMQYCKNAKSISEFKDKIVRRKEDAVIEYFQSQRLIAEFNNIEKIYRSNGFKKLSPTWATKIDSIEAYVQKISNTKKEWSRYNYELSRWFSFNNKPNTKEQKVYLKIIKDMVEMQVLNSDTMRYMSVPYNMDDKGHEAFWQIVEKMLVY
jgi:hypothetical protein